MFRIAPLGPNDEYLPIYRLNEIVAPRYSRRAGLRPRNSKRDRPIARENSSRSANPRPRLRLRAGELSSATRDWRTVQAEKHTGWPFCSGRLETLTTRETFDKTIVLWSADRCAARRARDLTRQLNKLHIYDQATRLGRSPRPSHGTDDTFPGRTD